MISAQLLADMRGSPHGRSPPRKNGLPPKQTLARLGLLWNTIVADVNHRRMREQLSHVEPLRKGMHHKQPRRCPVGCLHPLSGVHPWPSPSPQATGPVWVHHGQPRASQKRACAPAPSCKPQPCAPAKQACANGEIEHLNCLTRIAHEQLSHGVDGNAWEAEMDQMPVICGTHGLTKIRTRELMLDGTPWAKSFEAIIEC